MIMNQMMQRQAAPQQHMMQVRIPPPACRPVRSPLPAAACLPPSALSAARCRLRACCSPHHALVTTSHAPPAADDDDADDGDTGATAGGGAATT